MSLTCDQVCTKFFKINIGTVRNPNVYLQINSLDYIGLLTIRTSSVVTNLNYLVFVTPAEKYTPYEKFSLPFDLETWILLVTTFIVTFLSIFVINRFSKSTQSLVYGHRVETPLWNVISIFFGIAQTKLPNKLFSRFILTMFIYFCLIFRTCFQSKFFEFMTSEPRRLPPKVIEDLIDRKYNVFATAGLYDYSNSLNWLKERSVLTY